MKRLIIVRQLIISLSLFLLISSCTKELSPIGMQLLDPLDLLSMGYTDTVQIKAYTIPEDSVYTLNLNYAQIGSMYDPIFGRTNATFYSQVYTTSTSVRFGTNPVFDSAFLYLPYKTAYGDTLSNMTFHVYALTESILDSVHSYSNRKVSYDEAHPLGEVTFQPRPHDSVFYSGKTQAPILRIAINSNFGDYVLAADTAHLNSAAAFAEYFKGICIVADQQNNPGKGCIVSFDLTSDYSLLQMYYHNTTDTTSDFFAVSTACKHFGNYDHNGYAEAIPMLRQQLQGNTSLGQQFLFAQGMGGTKIKIEFPYLKQWADAEKIVINDAQLVLGNSSNSDVFLKPVQLTLRGVGEAGSTNPFTIVDESEGSTYFDGTYKSSSNSYRFRLTRFIQQMLTDKVNNNGLHLIIPSASYSGARLVLNGTSSPQSDLKLYLRYTRIK
ncbi:MAG: DUF4270 family protein [Bacteroidota bacterium]